MKNEMGITVGFFLMHATFIESFFSGMYYIWTQQTKDYLIKDLLASKCTFQNRIQ